MEDPRRSSEQSSEGPTCGGIARSETAAPRKIATAKRKMTTKPIETKYEAILEVEKGVKTKAQIARDFDVPSNTLSTWLKNAASIKDGYLKFGAKRMKLRAGNFEELENAILKWFTATRDSNIPVSGPLLQAKAVEFAEKLGTADFKASVGWLNRFKERHGIAFKKICGESTSVNDGSDSMLAWQKSLHAILQKYKADDIFNADEPDTPEEETDNRLPLATCIDTSIKLRNHLETSDTPPEIYDMMCKVADYFEKKDIQRRCGKKSMIIAFFK